MSDSLQDIDISALNLDPPTRELFQQLLNHIESLIVENKELRSQTQQLKDEIARLKGEKGKPDIKPNRQPPLSPQKAKPKPQSKQETPSKLLPRQKRIKIDREDVVKLDREGLPKDVVHRGYREVIIQNIVFQTDTVLYRLERLHSPSTGQLYEAHLPEALRGQSYGSELAGFVLMLYFELRVPQEKILKLLQSQGIVISAGEVSNILTRKYLSLFVQERQAVLQAGLASTSYQHIDDTGMRVDGENWYALTLCNPYYSCFFTNPRKNRETVKQLLSPPEASSAVAGGSSFGEAVQPQETVVNEKRLGDYVEILVSDDAGQFSQVTKYRALCWIHEGRHYEKLTPFIKTHQQMVEGFLVEFWAYYQRLKDYQRAPTPVQKIILSEEFDRLFSRQTGYEALDHRIALTRQKKQHLLVVLDFPSVPLDNNEAERSLREYVIKRKISNGTRTEEGTRAWEVFLSLVGTCRKNGVNFYQYLLDRISKTFRMPALATRVLEHAQSPLS